MKKDPEEYILMNETFKKYFFMLLKLTVAAVLLYHVGKDLDYSSLKKLSPAGLCMGFFLSLLIIMFQTVLSAVRWKMLLASQGIDMPLMRAVSLTFQGSMFSLFLPGGSVGGDVIKAAFLTRESDRKKTVEAVTTIFLDRVIGMLGLFSLAGILALCSFPFVKNFNPAIRYTVYILALCCFGGVCCGIVLFFQHLIFRIKLFALLLKKADSFTKGACSRILASVDVCRKDTATLWKCFFLTLLVLHPLLISCSVLILCGTGETNIKYTQAAVLSSSLGNVASVAPVSPGGLGTRDKVTEVILRQSTISKDRSSLIPLIYSCAYVSAGLLGGVFFFLKDTFRKVRTSGKS